MKTPSQPPERLPIDLTDGGKQLEVVMQEYTAIRGEVLTTLASQVAVLSFGAATVGLLVAAAAALWQDHAALSGLTLLLGVPLLSFLTLAVYGGELVRLMRAGLFLHHLECDVNRAFEAQSPGGAAPRTPTGRPAVRVLSWEQWDDIRQGNDIDRMNRRAISGVFAVLAVGSFVAGFARLSMQDGIPWYWAAAAALASLLLMTGLSCWLMCLTRFAHEYRRLAQPGRAQDRISIGRVALRRPRRRDGPGDSSDTMNRCRPPTTSP